MELDEITFMDLLIKLYLKLKPSNSTLISYVIQS